IRRRRRDARAHEIGHERLDETVLIDTEVVDDLVDDALVRLRRADADLEAEERRSVPGAQDESRAAARVDLAEPRLIAEVERVARALGGADLDDEELVERAAVPLVGAGRRDDVRAAVEVRDVADEEAGAADAGIEVELEEILTGETREGRAAGDVDDGRDIRDQPVRLIGIDRHAVDVRHKDLDEAAIVGAESVRKRVDEAISLGSDRNAELKAEEAFRVAAADREARRATRIDIRARVP